MTFLYFIYLLFFWIHLITITTEFIYPLNYIRVYSLRDFARRLQFPGLFRVLVGSLPLAIDVAKNVIYKAVHINAPHVTVQATNSSTTTYKQLYLLIHINSVTF